MAEKIVVYGNEFCNMVPPVRNLLDRADAAYDYVSITFDRSARRRVMEINDGKASLPTLVFPDGSTLTEPTLDVLTARLQALGHTIAPDTFWRTVLLTVESPRLLNYALIFLAIGLGFGNQPALVFAGGVLLAIAIVGRLAGMISRR